MTAPASAGGPSAPMEYGMSAMCPGDNVKEPGHDDNCSMSLGYCAGNPPTLGDGPAVYVFSRLVGSTPWTNIGHTCWPELVPGPQAPTMAMIIDAFHRTPFAEPGVDIQPEGDRTLVTLPTYFAMQWSEAGYEPEEIDTLNPGDWFGITVRIKPLFQSVTYDFGDGTSIGPTTDLGGPHPTGDIVKTYDEPNVFNVQVHAVLTGQVSLNGSEWIDIPGQADLEGPAHELTVLTADNRLYLPSS